MSSIVNKVKEALHSDKSSHTEGTHTHAGTTAGHTTGTTGGLHESSHAGTGTHEGAYGSTGLDSNRHNAQRTDGPHGNLGNKLDPRVDSDRDHSRNLGANPDRSANPTSHTGHTGGLTGSTGTHTGGLTGSHAGTTTGTSGLSGLDNRHNAQRTDGPHGNLGNKLDPRVDSDRDHSRNLGANPDRSANTTSHTGHTGGSTLGHTGGGLGTSSVPGSQTTGAGAHTSGLNSGHTLGSSTGTTGATTGLHGSHTSGPAPNTQGPHKSDLLNKADPRVDSDADGSKTYGGDKTYAH